ncbi:class C sortase [Sinomonas albida]|uniref:class C sortase n=1 Tax=Sinomonas albida TaxID=369942 RepID=UPI0010A85F67|nr:class C sortase [Sinomonas albida]
MIDAPAVLQPRRLAAPRRWKASGLLITTAVAAVIGATTLTYPSAASWVSSLNQSQVVEHYQGSVDHAEPSAAEQLAAADRYNGALSSGAEVEANTRKPIGAGSATGDLGDYPSQLETPTGVVSRIQIPKVGVDLPVYHGTSDAVLLKGAGHLEGTSLPVGGDGTLTVITGHRGLAEATMFTNLDQLKAGDTFVITTFGRVLTYRVFDTRVVEPSDTASLHPKAGRDLATLITCTPLGTNSHRILVTGERVMPTPKSDVDASRSGPAAVTFPWWLVLYLGGLAIIGVYVWWGGRSRRSQMPAAKRDSAHDSAPRRRISRLSQPSEER